MLNMVRFMLKPLIIRCFTSNKADASSGDRVVGAYLAGLLEGDGYIDIPKNSNKTKRISPRFVFTFHKKNLSLFKQLHKFIGSGFFKTGPGNTMRYVVADKQGITGTIRLTDGCSRTPKIITFYKLIDDFNTYFSMTIVKLPIDKSPLNNNSWLAGFAEADAYFGVSMIDFKPKSETRKRSQSRRVKCRNAFGH